MRNFKTISAAVLILIAAAALSVAISASASKGGEKSGDHAHGGKSQEHSHGHGHSATPRGSYNLKGVYAGGSVVDVRRGSKKAERLGFVGREVSFDLSSAQIRTADTNNDGERTLEDVAVGSRVRVKGRFGDGTEPLTARRLEVDKGRHGGGPPEEEPEED